MPELPAAFLNTLNARKTVCVMGLGFVGSAMALAIASAKAEDGSPLYNVIGVNRPSASGERKVNAINAGVFPFENNDEKLKKAFAEAHGNGNLFATTDFACFELASVVVVDINLDVSYREDGEPYLDMTFFKQAMHDLGKRIQPGTLVVVETTVPPGTCERIVLPILTEELQARGNASAPSASSTPPVYVAHSYERVMPGKDYFDSIINFWRVYSGVNAESADRCEAFLKTVIKTDKYPLTRLEKTNATEIAKVLENSYRATTIAFMEEWGRFAEEIGVDLFEVINAIRMRPTHSNMREPGFGVGGYCLTKDPYFAMLSAKNIFGIEGMDFPFSTMAVRTNNAMPLVSLDKIQAALGGSLDGKKLLVLGVSYRQDVGDTRHSPTEIFAKEAVKRGAVLTYQDPLVPYFSEMCAEVLHDLPVSSTCTPSVSTSALTISFRGYDAVAFTVRHGQYAAIDFTTLEADPDTLIFDANGVLNVEQREAVRQRKDLRFAAIGR